MNTKITHSWLLEYLDTKATPLEIQKYLSLCGPSIEKVEKTQGGDYVYDVEITSNRVDTASVMGIAREAATILTRFGIKSAYKPPRLEFSKQTAETGLPLDIVDSKGLCKRIMAVVMDNITIKPSPKLIQKRLQDVGIRSLNNVVDITNYVMTEIGHPTHVFDYDRIMTHKLIIRKAKNNEEIVTLDEKKYLLSDEDVIIDDGTGRVIDLPGIMGTANSVVTKETKRIIFFIESNSPVAIRRSSMRYGIRTVAATINEKAPDPELVEVALIKGIDLFKEMAGAKVSGGIIDIFPKKPTNTIININLEYINKKIGVVISLEQVVKILKGLQFDVKVTKESILNIKVPSFRRNDVLIREDIIEEIARIYGYHNLPNNLSPARYVKQPKEFEDLFVNTNKIKLFLKHIGLHEVLNYSMISLSMIHNFGLNEKQHLYLSNVLSEDIKYLRITLLPSLVKNIKTNEGRQKIMRFFELAKVYKPKTNSLPEESYKLGIALNTSFDDLKGVVEALLDELHIDQYAFNRSSSPYFSTTQAALFIKGEEVGLLGKLKPSYQESNLLSYECMLAEIDFDRLIHHVKQVSNYKPLHPFAIIKLDTSFILSSTLSYEQFRDKAFKMSNLLNKVEVVDRYKNKVTIRLYFSSPHKNITEGEAKEALQLINPSRG